MLVLPRTSAGAPLTLKPSSCVIISVALMDVTKDASEPQSMAATASGKASSAPAEAAAVCSAQLGEAAAGRVVAARADLKDQGSVTPGQQKRFHGRKEF